LIEAKMLAIWLPIFFSVPSMGNNLVVKAHYGLGSRNR